MARYGSVTTEVAIQKWFNSDHPLSSDETVRLMRWIERSPRKLHHNVRTQQVNTISRRMSAISDRRSFKPSPDFPFEDHNGNTISEERRFAPDRRVNNIEVEWLL